jgi:SAM-dependent MidA family methyltransferase
MNAIIERLKKKSNPPWSFAMLMEVALYDPELGYYTKERQKLGKEGDFYTSNHVHPVFAETFGRFFLDVLVQEDMEPTICEWGAGDGAFAFHVLSYIKSQNINTFKNTFYYIIESSPHHQSLLTKKLAPFKDQISIYATFEEMIEERKQFQGILFSNELIDAFPVHIIEKHKDGLKEVFLEEVEGELVENLTICNNDRIKGWFKEFGPTLPEGHRIEVSLAMKEWLVNVSRWLDKGMIITIDYGYRNDEFQRPERREGSIRGYRNHEMIKNPLRHLGDMDLTSHIQWDAYDQIALNEGLTKICYERQDQFLLKAGLFSFLQSPTNLSPFSDEFKKNRAIQSFVHPSGISTSFQVNVHGKKMKNVENYRFFNEDPYQIKNLDS